MAIRGSIARTLPHDLYPTKQALKKIEEERICESPNCNTVLSKYNKGNICSSCLERDKWNSLLKESSY